MKHTAEKKPSRPKGEDLRALRQEEILDAAARLFAEHGYADTDTQLLADDLGVGKGTLYRYFVNKEALFLAAVDRAMIMLRAQVDTGIAGIEDPLDQIAEAIHIYLAFFADHPHFVELLMQERAQFKRDRQPTYFRHRAANIERWRDLYRSLIAAGRIRDMPVERITDVMSDLLYGTMFTNFLTDRKKPFREQAQDILDVAFHGILSDSERQWRRSQS